MKAENSLCIFMDIAPTNGSTIFSLDTGKLYLLTLLLHLSLVLLVPDSPTFANSVDPDQLASSEANWSGSALFVIQHVSLYQQPGSSNLIGWQAEVGMAS